MKAHEHWEDVYRRKADTELSWHQPSPACALRWIVSRVPDRSAPIIDVGGGTSRLVDHLLAEGYCDLTVLDVSEAALARSKTRLGANATGVSWIAADVTVWQPERAFRLWHDRAVFHFLTEATAQDAYLAALARGTAPGSFVIMATFAPEGPERCSGLPVQRYSAQSLAARLGGIFALRESAAERHETPAGIVQHFNFALFQREG